MLRKRSIPVAGKPSPSSSHGGSKSKKPPSPLSLSPNRRLFRSFSSKGFSDHEVVAMNPNSIPEPKHLSFSKQQQQQPAKPPLELRSKPIGLGIVDALIEDAAKGSRSMILFGSQLKTKIPSMDSPSSPIEFGVKNKDSLLALVSPGAPFSPPAFAAGSVSVAELEKSEDYTCIISRGPNPKTTHIFDDCVLESFGVDEFTAVRKKTSGAGMGTQSA
ncbi:FCS-Like Zinc finger 8-like [Zingiber officinale]|uniref:FCS-Like Zinc finger 8-like n=1 Tax=Zingiber officinale TaxID=94328 RepID=UPI001C4B44C6|nr:FCS-Like Zinc finger 8-like [Zingiber officinale]